MDFTVMTFSVSVLFASALALGGMLVYRKVVRLTALALPAQQAARQHLKSLRFEKMDKPSVMILSLQKGGSTLMCYVCALVNTRNAIDKFRNDFDLVPMLSFPQPMIYQNINARQEGKFQLYKINGRARIFRDLLKNQYKQHKTVWLCREFSGYYRSVYWWVKNFYPRVRPLRVIRVRVFLFLQGLKWDLFKNQTLKLLAEDHVEELWYVYSLLKESPTDDFLALSYEHLCSDKVNTLSKLASWFGIDADEAMLTSIADKTSKEAMAEGDRFDPLHFGDGGGQSKVNLEPHTHALSPEDMEIYHQIFIQRFEKVGIHSYEEYIEEIRRLQS